MALYNLDDFQCIQFNIPFHKDCSDFFEYTKNMRKIQEETETDLQILQIVRIKGNEKKVEEARLRVSQLNDSQDEKPKQENKDNMHQLLKDIQNKIFEAEREKTKISDAIQQLKAGFQEEIKVIKNKLEEIRKDEDADAGEANFYKFIASDGYTNFFSKNMNDKPLHIASALGRLDIVKRLLKKGGSVNNKTNSGSTALIRASQNGHLPVVKYLIKKGAYIDAQDYYGQSAIYLATCNKRKDIVEYLCSQNACVHLKTANSSTSINYARQSGYTEILQILEKYAS